MKKNKVKQIIIAAVGGAVVMLIALSIVRAIERKVNAPSEEQIVAQLIEGLEKGAKELNSKTPLMVDDETRLDSVTVGPGLTSNYFYTFPNYSSLEIESETATSTLKIDILSNICNNKEMKTTLSHGGVLNYSYLGNDNKEISKIRIDVSDCK